MNPNRSPRRAGFTVAEFAAVIAVLAVMAGYAAPKLRQLAQRADARAAFDYLAAVRAAQERRAERLSAYAADLKDLDVAAPAPRNFAVGRLSPGATGKIRDSWTLTLTRGASRFGGGGYTVIFDENGFDDRSTIPAELSPMGAP